jgi:hypothetical protein
MALEMGVAFLGSIPIDARVVQASDAGRPCVSELAGTGASDAFERAIRPILELDDESKQVGQDREELSQRGEETYA